MGEFKVTTVEVAAVSRKEWLANRRSDRRVIRSATAASATAGTSENIGADSAWSELFTKVNIGTEDDPLYAIRANFGLYSVGFISAKGIGNVSSGAGGGSSTLAGLNDVALTGAITNDMLVYNGTHWVNTPMSAIKPDLSAYATKVELNTIALRLSNVETIFEADSDGAINKWSEVVAFLDGIEGDTLDSILSQFATMQWVEGKGYITSAALNGYATQDWVEGKKYLDGITSAMVTTALGYTPYNSANFTKTNIKAALGISDWALAASKPSYNYSEINETPDLSVYLPLEGGTISGSLAVNNTLRIGDAILEWDSTNNGLKVTHADGTTKAGLYASGYVSARGVGSSSGGSSGGSGASYNRLDAWADYTNDKSGWVLSALLGKDLDTRVNALANAGYITASALDPYAKSADVANTYATQTALQGVDIRVQAIEYIFEKDNDGVINKWSEIVDFLAGVEGTTLDSILEQFATKDAIKTKADDSKVVHIDQGGFANNGNADDFMNPSTLTIIGGSSENNWPTTQTANAYGNMIVVRGNAPYFTTQFLISTNGAYYRLCNNEVWDSWKQILHSGNYTDYTVPKTGGTFSGSLYVQTSNSNGFANEINGAGSYSIHCPNVASTSSWARGLSLYDDATSTKRDLIATYGNYEGNKYDYLGGTYDNHILQLRLSDKFSTFYGSVKTFDKFIGDLQGNADSATKLATACSIWGQSFNGTGNVDGPATMNGDGKDLYWRCKSPNYELGFGIDSGNVNRGIYDFTNSSWWIYRDATANTYIPQGYVGIGTTNPQRALHIVSTLNRQMMVESSDYTEASINYQAKNGVRWVVGEGCMQVVDSFGFWNESLNTNAITILKSGFVGVGTLTPTCKLYVKGDSYVSGNAHVASSLFVDDNIYLAESTSRGAIFFGDDEYAYIKESPDDVMTIASNQGLILRVNHISDEGAVIKLDGPVRIGDAILSWDETNKALKVSHADGTTAAGLYATGFVTAKKTS